MTTEQQPTGIVQRNRQNAERSTGPRTDAGITKSRANAVRHGVFAQAVVLDDPKTGDTPGAFRSLHDRLVADLIPVGELESLTVERIAVLHWRLRRLYLAECGEIRAAQEQAGWVPLEMDARRAEDTRRRGTYGLGIGSIVDSPLSLSTALELLEQAGAEVEEAGTLGEDTQKRIARIWGIHEGEFTEAILIFSTAANADELDIPPDKCKAALVYAIGAETDRLRTLKEIAEERRDDAMKAGAAVALVPPDAAMNRLVRYEAHLERVLARAIEQLDRLQRGRRGEPAPPTVRLERSP